MIKWVIKKIFKEEYLEIFNKFARLNSKCAFLQEKVSEMNKELELFRDAKA